MSNISSRLNWTNTLNLMLLASHTTTISFAKSKQTIENNFCGVNFTRVELEARQCWKVNVNRYVYE